MTPPIKTRIAEAAFKYTDDWSTRWHNRTNAYEAGATEFYEIGKAEAEALMQETHVEREAVQKVWPSVRYALGLVIRRFDIDEETKAAARIAYAELEMLATSSQPKAKEG